MNAPDKLEDVTLAHIETAAAELARHIVRTPTKPWLDEGGVSPTLSLKHQETIRKHKYHLLRSVRIASQVHDLRRVHIPTSLHLHPLWRTEELLPTRTIIINISGLIRVRVVVVHLGSSPLLRA